ncbi:MAG: hypothetical protein ACF8R9_12410 [Phycisphaerales bacterium JB054]
MHNAQHSAINAVPTPRRGRRLVLAALGAGLVGSVLGANGCSCTIPSRDPTGERIPAVVGQSLEKERTEMPAAFAGRPAVLLVGYKQGTQFDLDRWLMGLTQAGVDAQLVEVPTIPGLVPTLASGWIDDGMRSGIPREDWGSVVTLYGSAAKPVAELTGNENGRRSRVIVLDAEGTIVWFDDEGYSARKALEVAELVAALASGAG